MSDQQDQPAPVSLGAMTFEPGYRLVLVLDPSGEIRAVVEAKGIGRFTAEAMVGRHVGGAAAGGVRGDSRRLAWEERIAEAHRNPAPVRYQDLRPDAHEGSMPVVSTTVTPIAADDGELQAILVSVHDWSEIVAIQQDAHEHRELLRSALDVTGLGTFSLSIREEHFECDERYREIFGDDPSAAVAERGFDALLEPLHPDDREPVGRVLEGALAARVEGVNYRADYRIWRPGPGGPELRRIHAVGRVEVDELGPRRLLGVVDDVTDRRREDELRVRMQKREAIGTLAAGMAHDFNNVISAILSNASVAASEVRAGADPMTSISEIARSAKRAGDLVRRMLEFSRDREPERVAVSLADVAEDACNLLRPTIARGVSLTARAQDDLPLLLGDAAQLRQVVVNLIANAGQALAGRPGLIEVEVDAHQLDRDGSGSHAGVRSGRYLRLRVRDDGDGIPEHELVRIFDPFFTTKERGEGMGLGLAAAQSIVRSHDGHITVDSLPGAGTTVAVLLPLSDVNAAVDATASADGTGDGLGIDGRPSMLEDAPPAAASAPKRPHVLFVDDERALATLAERALPRHGCDVTAYTEPRAALAAFRETPTRFDALVTDLAMPTLTGFELIAAVRRIRRDLPVVLTSGFLTAESRAEATRLAVDHVVPKPCAIDALAAAVIASTRAAAG